MQPIGRADRTRQCALQGRQLLAGASCTTVVALTKTACVADEREARWIAITLKSEARSPVQRRSYCCTYREPITHSTRHLAAYPCLLIEKARCCMTRQLLRAKRLLRPLLLLLLFLTASARCHHKLLLQPKSQKANKPNLNQATTRSSHGQSIHPEPHGELACRVVTDNFVCV